MQAPVETSVSVIPGNRAMLATLRARPGQKVSTSTRPSVLEAHGRHEHYPEVRPPLAVVFAASVTDVQEGLARCREHYVPVISFGVLGQHGPLEPRVRPYWPIRVLRSRAKRALI